MSKKNIIIIAGVNYDFKMKQRSHYLAEYFGYDNNILYVNPTFSSKKSDNPNIKVWPVRLERLKPKSIKQFLNSRIINIDQLPFMDRIRQFIRKSNSKEFERILAEISKENNKYVIFEYPYYTEDISSMKKLGFKIIYDCIDDINIFPNTDNKLLLKETDLIEKADKIIVTSKNLLNRIYPKKGIVIENGANIKLFKCARKRMTKPKDLPTKGQWTIGYFGAVYEWFDVDLIKSLATELKGSNIIIIGDYLKEVKDKLSKYTNISLLGIKEHADLPQYLSHFDVCIIPFKKSRLNASINPIKVYEYLAGLKPVVATNLSEIKDYPYTYVSKSNSEFIKNVKIAAKAKVDSNKVDSFLAKRTWDSRINLFEKEINNMD